MIGESSGRKYETFDHVEMLKRAKENPMEFVADRPERVTLDEIQRVPELFVAIKHAIDQRRVPGRFLLTGSTNLLPNRQLSDSLAGRIRFVRMHPLAQCEVSGSGGNFLDALFAEGPPERNFVRPSPSAESEFHQLELFKPPVEGEKKLLQRICMGGYPPSLASPTEREQAEWCANYCRARHLRDILDQKSALMRKTLPRMLRYTASLTATLVNLSIVARKFGIDSKTADSYLAALEQMFLIKKLPPWRENDHARAVLTPKLHFGDPGLAAALLRTSPSRLQSKPGLAGRLLETFAFQELRRQASWHEEPLVFSHFRNRDSHEVDLVIEKGDRIAGIEVKSGSKVSLHDFRSLMTLKRIAGKRFARGIVLCDSRNVAPLVKDPSLCSVPLSRLWGE